MWLDASDYRSADAVDKDGTCATAESSEHGLLQGLVDMVRRAGAGVCAWGHAVGSLADDWGPGRERAPIQGWRGGCGVWDSRDEPIQGDALNAPSLERRARTLFLDDDPQRAEAFLNVNPSTVWVDTADGCIARLSDEWDAVYLDHDLGGEIYVDSERDDCGMAVVRFIVGARPEHLKTTTFVVHSHNIMAAVHMVEALRRAGYACEYAPFSIQ